MAVLSAIAGVAAGAAALAGSKSNSKAITTAANAQSESNAASIALQQDIYNQNKTALQPYQATGLGAMNQLNALYGIGTPGPISTNVPQAAYVPQMGFEGLDGPYGRLPTNTGTTNAMSNGPFDFASPQRAAQSAFDTWKNSTGYQTGLNEGIDAVKSAYAGTGMFQSGAAARGIMRGSADYATGKFNEYAAGLGNQQALGFSAASAQSGVGQNYANSISSLNSNNANALASIAAARANNQTGLYNALGTIVGGIAGRAG